MGGKGPALFWEKEWGNINSTNYDEKVLSYIQRFLQEHAEEGYIFMQDNARSHRSYQTKINLLRREIPLSSSPLTRQILILLSTSGIG